MLCSERKLMGGKYRAKENSRRHRKAFEKGEELQLRRWVDTEWVIQSFTESTRFYRIVAVPCPCENDKLHRPLCHVCPAGTTCTCSGSVKSEIAFEHVHAWALYHDESCTVSVTATAGTEYVIDDNNNYSNKSVLAKINEYCDRICFAALSYQRSGKRETLDNIVKKLNYILIEDCNVDLPGLIPRRHCPVRGKVVVTPQTGIRKLARGCSKGAQDRCFNFHPTDIDLNGIQVWAICEELQPELEDPEDEEAMLGADIDCWACDKARPGYIRAVQIISAVPYDGQRVWPRLMYLFIHCSFRLKHDMRILLDLPGKRKDKENHVPSTSKRIRIFDEYTRKAHPSKRLKCGEHICRGPSFRQEAVKKAKLLQNVDIADTFTMFTVWMQPEYSSNDDVPSEDSPTKKVLSNAAEVQKGYIVSPPGNIPLAEAGPLIHDLINQWDIRSLTEHTTAEKKT
ncbi:hypothetical protein GCK32_002573 [Trichostrongylus colubriformis]|uniref:Uncharacterized protein n=1 Tax=Trichostrongylus colubriformis TaxID=6319 RepID=A0AAN8G103_TRICO